MSPLIAELDRRIAQHDLLCHPFYQAWEAGRLSRADLREYAAEYYAQVSAFPTYLSRLHARMEDGPRRRALLRNLAGEELAGRAHSELWLDFAEEMGNDRARVRERALTPAMQALIAQFRELAAEGSEAAAFAAFYAYESQVPRIAETKARGLRERYGVSARGTAYFTLHATADIEHANAWRRELAAMAEEDPAQGDALLSAGEATARGLWQVLDAMEAQRQA